MAGTGGHAGQTDWRDWGAGLPGDPAERARAAEVGLAEALAVSDVPKAPGPGPLAGEERCLAGQAAREASPAVRLADVCETLSIPKSTYLSQRARLSRPDPEAALRARVRASFEASGGAFGSESVWADLRRGEGEPVPWGDLGGRGDPGRRLREGGAPGDARGGPRAPQGGPDAPEGEVQQLRREVRREGGQPVPPRGRGARLPRRRARPALRRRRHRVPAGRLQGLPRRGRRLPRRLAGVPGGCPRAPTRGWRSARSGTWSPPCARRRRARRSCTATGARRARCRARPGARTTRGARGFFGTLKSDFFHGTDWRGVTFAEFRERLGAHVEWHGGGKPKKALGWRTLREHRTALGYAA